MTTLAIVAAGAMGSAIAARVTEHGGRVLTSLDGRGPATCARARAAGMEAVDEAGLVQADMILSVVPPADAMALARRLAPALTAVTRKPIYVDCSAVNIETIRAIADLIATTGTPFLDAAIIGLPPKAGMVGPRIHVSGEGGEALLPLRDLSLDIRPMSGGIAAASALKMSYAGINKGLTALAALMVLAADRAGAGPALRAELAENEPELLARFDRSLPDMVPKAYRWVAEMGEIAGFLGDDVAGRLIFEGAAELYARFAAEGGAAEVAALRTFATSGGSSQPS